MIQNTKDGSKRSWIRSLRQVFSSRTDELVLNDILFQDVGSFPISDKMHWLEQLLQWLFQDVEKIEVRFRFFFKVLDQNPEWKVHFQQAVIAILTNCRFLGFLTNVGYDVDHGLWSDITKRLKDKILPSGGRVDFQDVFLAVFKSNESVSAIRSVSNETLSKIAELIRISEASEGWNRLGQQSLEALLFLSTHVAHYGISSEIVDRLSQRDAISNSPFLRLSEALYHGDSENIPEILNLCERALEQVYANMDETGVSVDVVNRLETVSALLTRIKRILDLRSSQTESERLAKVRDLLIVVIEAGIRGRSVLSFINRHFYLLSKKIAERNGHSAEHYIAQTGSELSLLFWSSVGGGGIVVLMTIFKTWLIHFNPPPFFLATGIWIIYSIGFLGMQFTGCTLATKIPSFTASRLASILKINRRNDLDGFRKEFRNTLKSQTVSLVGNVLGLVPLALLLSYLFEKVFAGYALMNEPYAQHILDSLHPVDAITLGALTGVQLWLSSLAGGWFENWLIFNRIPDAIENHDRLKQVFGETAAKRLAEWLTHHASGIASNVSLGFLFGFVPLFAGLFGLNGNGHHVTISSTSAVFAMFDLHFAITPAVWTWSIVGLLLVAFMNFGVSFCLALFIAGKAQRMKFTRILQYLKSSL